MDWLILGVATTLVLYALAVVALAVAGRRSHAAALARFVPDCAVLFARLARDRRVPASRRALVAVLALYLASPIDLVPDFVPVAGQLDDAILVALVLRLLLRGAGPDLVREHWPGPDASLRAVLRLGAGSTVDCRDGDAGDDRADHDAPDGRIGDRGHRARVVEAGRRRRHGG